MFRATPLADRMAPTRRTPSPPPAAVTSPTAERARCAFALSPAGALYLDPSPDPAETVAPAIAARVSAACATSAGAALLYLGACEPTAPLPAVLGFFRAFACRFVAAVCATPDL